ncbi:MAG: hypothetical protein LC633_09635 [Desulfobulbaceae bacterium]|nr:hypothetical protein [Desulfobulbaceae bacterium]
MAETIKLEVVTPRGAVLSENVDIVTAPGYGGEFGVLANHAPFLSTIKIGRPRFFSIFSIGKPHFMCGFFLLAFRPARPGPSKVAKYRFENIC